MKPKFSRFLTGFRNKHNNQYENDQKLENNGKMKAK